MKHLIIFLMIIVIIVMYLTMLPPKIKWEQQKIIVSEGETLWSISKKFCPESEDRRKWIYKVKNLNNTNGNIHEGQVLIVLSPVNKEE